ncbi:MAG: hypothetical protein AB7G23_02950 [Vicinamibacterales bacterium]
MQDNLTDGFIPDSVLPHLGVAKPEPLAAKLTAARLWDRVEGGWQIHDYLQHNNSRAHVETVRAKKRVNGNQGGRPPKPKREPNGNLNGFHDGFPVGLTPENPSNSEHRTANIEQRTEPQTPVPEDPPSASPPVAVDVEFGTFLDAYPPGGRRAGFRAQSAFVDARKLVSLEVLLASVAEHVASEQWQWGIVPGMDRWLIERRWLAHPRPADAPKGPDHGVCPADAVHDPPCRTWQEHTTRTLEQARLARAGGPTT